MQERHWKVNYPLAALPPPAVPAPPAVRPPPPALAPIQPDPAAPSAASFINTATIDLMPGTSYTLHAANGAGSSAFRATWRRRRRQIWCRSSRPNAPPRRNPTLRAPPPATSAPAAPPHRPLESWRRLGQRRPKPNGRGPPGRRSLSASSRSSS